MVALKTAFCFVISIVLLGCTIQGAKKNYILAERLWADGNYTGSVREFEKVIKTDPKSILGLQALFRSAMTQTLFLEQHAEALEKLKTYLQLTEDPEMSWNARKEVGEILFSKQRKYASALAWYQELLHQRPRSPDASEIHYRIARAQFFLWKFEEAIQSFKEIELKYPKTSWAEKSAFDVGMTFFTSAGEEEATLGFNQAIQSFEAFIKRYPSSKFIAQAEFWIASSFEELDRLEEAFTRFSALKGRHPEAHLVEVKLKRIQERRGRSRSQK